MHQAFYRISGSLEFLLAERKEDSMPLKTLNVFATLMDAMSDAFKADHSRECVTQVAGANEVGNLKVHKALIQKFVFETPIVKTHMGAIKPPVMIGADSHGY